MFLLFKYSSGDFVKSKLWLSPGIFHKLARQSQTAQPGLFIEFISWHVLRNVATPAVGIKWAAEPQWASSMGGSEKSFS